MKFLSILILLFIFIINISCAQEIDQKLIIKNLEIPKLNSGEEVIFHKGYSLLYNEDHEQASWVAYELTKEETNKIYDRTDKFIVDPLVKTGSATNSDYSGSGYDRGHLAPAADMGWSEVTMAESFYYSNMSPQEPGFNRGIWKKLEELVRDWAIENNSIYIATGPILTDGLTTIGTGKLLVPKYYYKVILDYTDPDIKAIGFLIPNSSQSGPLQNFVVTIDSIESFSGIDFFQKLPDEQESKLENSFNINSWTWTSTKSANTANIKKNTASSQCNGTTKSGSRCKNKTLNPSGYCYLHENHIKGS
jgi:endonuclease G